jgi:folate-binding protein YgfZ
MADNGYVILERRGVLAVGGQDAATLLQGLVSNDVLKVGPERAVHAALLTPQGKYLHDFFIARHGEALLLDCEAERLDDLLRRLRMYRLRAKVTIENAGADFAVAALFGPQAPSSLGLEAAGAGAARAWGGGVAFVDPRLADLGLRALLPRGAAAEALASTGLPAAAAEDYDALRLTLGVPDGTRDMAVEKSILLECNFDALNGVAWDKGCYVGQELTARTHYRGLVKKRLLPVRVDGPLPAPGTPVMLDGREAGEIRSGLGDRALALLRLEEVKAAGTAGTPLTAGGTAIHPERPAWLPG